MQVVAAQRPPAEQDSVQQVLGSAGLHVPPIAVQNFEVVHWFFPVSQTPEQHFVGEPLQAEPSERHAPPLVVQTLLWHEPTQHVFPPLQSPPFATQIVPELQVFVASHVPWQQGGPPTVHDAPRFPLHAGWHVAPSQVPVQQGNPPNAGSVQPW